MSALIETSVGRIVVDTFYKECPLVARNWLALCGIGLYDGTLIHQAQADVAVHAGDPTGRGDGGTCIHGLMDADYGRFMTANLAAQESEAALRKQYGHRGLVYMTKMEGRPGAVGSQFLILCGTDARAPYGCQLLGRVVQGFDVVRSMERRPVREADMRPLQDIRIVRAIVLFDPFSPVKQDERAVVDMVLSAAHAPSDESRPAPVLTTGVEAYAWQANEQAQLTAMTVPVSPVPIELQVQRWNGWKHVLLGTGTHAVSDESTPAECDWTGLASTRRAELISAGVTQQDMLQAAVRMRNVAVNEQRRHVIMRQMLQMLGDIPDASLQPPEHVLFVCKLHPLTSEDALSIVFGRWGRVQDAHIVFDHDTGRSKCYAFVEFASVAECNRAYRARNKVVIDGRRIVVDFCQSVSKSRVRSLLERGIRREFGAAPHPSGVEGPEIQPCQTVDAAGRARVQPHR